MTITTRRKGMTLRVTEDKLAQLIRDLNGTVDCLDMSGVMLDVRMDDVWAAKREDDDPHYYIVRLDKWQRRHLESRANVQRWADEYGEAKG